MIVEWSVKQNMSSNRIMRISEEMKREVSDIILTKLKDPRATGMISVVKASVTKDMRYAKIYVSVLGSDDDKKHALEGLKNAAGFIRKEIGQRIKLHFTPEIIFEIDDSIEYGVKISNILKQISSAEEKSEND